MDKELAHQDDAQIVKLSLENKDNFGILIGRYKDKIERYIKRIAAFSDDRVEDILQEVFVKTYVHLNGFDQSLSFSSWIYRIAHNETISYFRKNKKHIDATNLISDEDLEYFSSEIHIEKEQYTKEFNKILSDAITELPENYKSVIILKFIEGKSYEDISDILQKPPGTIAVWINRAKKDLKKILNKKGIQEYE